MGRTIRGWRLKQPSIQSLAWALVTAMLVTLVIMIVGAIIVIRGTGDVAERWRIYDLEAATKADALSELRSTMGFGGVIHAFRDYQIQGLDELRRKVEAGLRAARANLEIYQAIAPMKPEERNAAESVAAALTAIESRLPMVAAAHAQGKPVNEIVTETDFDAQPALDGMRMLNSTLTLRRALLTADNALSIEELHTVIFVSGWIQGLLIFSLAMSSLWVVRKRVLQPLLRLGRQSAKLAEGELETPFLWTLDDEFGRLGRIFDESREAMRSLFAELLYQATHDDLTGLPNRAYLLQWLQDLMVRRSPDSNMTLLFLDLDDFKVINNTLGHGVGDRLLQAVAGRLSNDLTEDHFLARLGGDEFVIGLRDGDEGDAMRLARRVEQDFARPFAVDHMELSISTSIGIAVDEGLCRTPAELLSDADIALYRAKERGPANTELFNASFREAILVLHRLRNDLTPAMERGDIFLVYQPIVRLSDAHPIGFEALVRWNHPELGLISPASFVPIAEETGQILPLGRFVLGQAAEAAAAWRQRYPKAADLSINVNLSPRQMWDEPYIDEMLEFLGSFPAGSVKIEVTEGMTMSNPDLAEIVLERFHAIGVPLCIDDFGTGYSSLAYLHRFPFDILKIDKSFVSGLEQSSSRCRLVSGIINLAHELGLKVVAEGVETKQERDRLREMHCDFGQGYLFARPLSRQSAEDLLAAYHHCNIEEVKGGLIR